MDTNILITILTTIVILVVGGFLAYAFYTSQRTKRLKSDFGSEYEKKVKQEGNRQKAEQKLSERQKRVESLHLRDLDPDEQEHFTRKWKRIQQDFVNGPAKAIEEADRFVVGVMLALGYPMRPFDRRVENISVNHPELVSNYRDAHAVTVKVDQFEIDTEELRLAMVNYQAVFEGLLGIQLEQEYSEPEPEMVEA